MTAGHVRVAIKHGHGQVARFDNAPPRRLTFDLVRLNLRFAITRHHDTKRNNSDHARLFSKRIKTASATVREKKADARKS